MPNLLEMIAQNEVRKDHPNFRVGDTVRVHFKIREGEKERIQIFEGVLIGERGGGSDGIWGAGQRRTGTVGLYAGI